MSEIIAAPIVHVRPWRPSDRAFIGNSWWHAHRLGSQLSHQLDPIVYAREQPALIDAILSRPTTLVCVAYDSIDTDAIFGYIVFDPLIHALHFVYVKSPLRRFGVMRALFLDRGIPLDTPQWKGLQHTQETATWRSLVGRHPGPKFNPYLAR